MTREAPHILVTTPGIAVHSAHRRRPREMLAEARTVIVDEIHAVADDKRGSHLALSLARLDRLVEAAWPTPRRSASAFRPRSGRSKKWPRFLSDGARPIGRDVGHRRAMDLAVEVPRDELGPVASKEMWGEIYDRVAALIREHRTTLVFVNTRRLAERVAHHLGERLGEDAVLPHHGSLRAGCAWKPSDGSRTANCARWWPPHRSNWASISARSTWCARSARRAPSRWRCSASGRVRPLGGRAAQGAPVRHHPRRAGRMRRAGARHPRAASSTGWRFRATPLDILAQQIVAARAPCREISAEDDLFALVRRAWPYRTLAARGFRRGGRDAVRGIATSRGRAARICIAMPVNHRVRGAARRAAGRHHLRRRHSRIPRNTWWWPSRKERTVGTVDEDFAVESMAGDVFLLGTTSWRIRRVEAGRVRVEDAHGAAPNIPFWRGEAPGRTLELSREVARLREEIAEADETGRARLAGMRGLERARRRAGLPPMCRPAARRWARVPGHAARSRRALLRRSRRHATGAFTRPSARASTAPGAWRCASASAGPSISNCRPRPPITASSFRWASSIRSRSISSSNFCARKRWKKC